MVLAWMLTPAFATPALAAGAPGQPPPKPPVIFRTLAIGASVSGVFYDCHGKPVPITAGFSGFSSPYVAPPDGHVLLYRVLPPEKPESPPRRVPVSTINMPGGGPYVLFMLTDPEKPSSPRVLMVDDSWATHPARTIKVYNFSRRATLVKIGDEAGELPSSQSHLFTCPEGSQAWLHAATREETGWVLRISSPQMSPPHTRSTVVLIDQAPSEDRPVTHEMLDRNFIDPEPPPPAP